MVSKRQRSARKRQKTEHPELFPNPEPTPTKDPQQSKKKKNKLKPNKKGLKAPRKSLSKHPLRVPGMRPGDSCFICKAKDHVAKLCPQKAQWDRHKICLHCRRQGHSLKNCPERNEETGEKKLCYNCGEAGHSLSKCPQPLQEGGTKFACCFICNERGHLSKNCRKNTHGIYPKGGSCKICGGVTHLAKDCPNKGNKFSISANIRTGMDSEERPKVIKFTSGDDLEDDFMLEDAGKSKKDGASTTKGENSHAKAKKKKDPKVVNFLG
ncbi:hypothetical protein Scep_026229 [Stephania cephalantha]|uniref:CCHC-type domain-containing protein n=1 Tax=Stephania cephalantha TaxID=152367 RepID=A0AAP0EM99_9MAGN